MSAAAGWLVETLLATALLLAAVLLVRRPVARAFGPQVAYALWALPALRLVLPPLPDLWPASITATPVSRAGEAITILVAPLATAPVDVASSIPSPGTMLGWAWLVGAALFLGAQLIAHYRFCHAVRRAGEQVDTVDGIAILVSAAVPGPVAFGVLHRAIAFPRDMAERYDAAERALALAHELGHHRRGDLVANWAALLMLALHWCNPLAWIAFRAFRADQEHANDARVLAGRGAAERHAYACAIVKATGGPRLAVACQLHDVADVKGRLLMLTVSPASRRRLLSGAAAIAAFGAAGLALTASGTRATAAVAAEAVEAVGVALPAPPTPEAPPAPPLPAQAIAPTPPAAPPAPEAPLPPPAIEAPPAPPVPPSDAVAWHHRGGRHVDVAVRSGDCGSGGTASSIVRQEGGRRVTVICNDRIAAAVARAQGEAWPAETRATIAMIDARDIERRSLTAALSGLRASRARVESRTWHEEARREALEGIDDAIRDIEKEIRDLD